MLELKLVCWTLGLIPLFRAWRANVGWSVSHAVVWGGVAWLAWGAVLVLNRGEAVALCLTAAAGVAVLGARRPHVGAWNFVVLGLVLVMLLPLAEEALIGARSYDGLRRVFLGATLALGIVNFLPTRLWGGAVGLGLGTTLLILETLDRDVALGAILLTPWMAWLTWRTSSGGETSLDCTWLDFRDRYGVVWGQRVREQFSATAKHRAWPTTLTWFGFQPAVSPAMESEVQANLEKLLQRFRPE